MAVLGGWLRLVYHGVHAMYLRFNNGPNASNLEQGTVTWQVDKQGGACSIARK